MTYDVAGFVLAAAAAVRVFAPDVAAVLRRLLGAGVRVGAATLMEQQRPADHSSALNEGDSR
ncbi:hypothetical protein [Streptomyces antimycoticus]|uniref:hypothetical protein n=1 Tax=Streptomyces antimycoticus TaxID=68175 RepID=UPI0034089487|nr:hypothetical protein OG751_00105 [Streptomyces antimycoticus]WTA86853.1 hypothetical protein OG751_47680 [Streptomyces antimycoticus]